MSNVPSQQPFNISAKGYKLRANRKAAKRLQARLSDFQRGPTSPSHDSQRGRWEQGGYHAPGSVK